MRAFVAALAALAVAVPAAQAHHPRGETIEDAARGLQYDGLVPARADGPCRGLGFEVHAGLTITCTHGPDPAPEGVDVRERPTIAELSAGSEAATPVPCIGDGVSGKRVQAVYAHPAGTPSAYESAKPLIQGWAENVNEILRASGAASGAERPVRFVTAASDAGCRATVAQATVSAAAATSFGAMVADLAAQGFNRSDRKYLVWMDAQQYCGIAEMIEDSEPGQTNPNNGPSFVRGLVARVDRQCWSATERVAATHELVHTLGGVLPGAPNASPAGHCTDEWDVMCYPDAPGVTMRFLCVPKEAYERRLDCNGDDYFDVTPTAGSWLAQHWNTANSAFLSSEPPPPAPGAPTGLRLADAGETALRVEWEPVDGAVGYRVYVDGAQRWGTGAPSVVLNGLPCGRAFTVSVEAFDARGTSSGGTTLAAATLPCVDRQPPSVTPRAGSGRRGAIVHLRYVVADASETSERITIFRGRTLVRSIVTGFATPAARAVRWRIPRTAKPPLRFCVRPTDRLGNAGASRCASIRLP